MDLSESSKLSEAATFVQRSGGVTPRVGLVLGSGLGALADELGSLVRLPYGAIPHHPTSSVAGHAGNLCLGELNGVPVACMQGRVHAYEGHPLSRVVFGVRLLAELGCRSVLLSNAAGGIAQRLVPGNLMLIDDHINLMGDNPLRGPNERGPRFPDLSFAYDRELSAACLAAADAAGLTLARGVYAGLLGPSYETPAEIRMLQVLGADAVGMSTVPEVIALRQLGVRVAAVSCITNLAAGRSQEPLSHAEVEATAARVKADFIRLFQGWVGRIRGPRMSRQPLSLLELTPDELALVERARAASERAYCRYSGYSVGSAIESDDGRIFTGCNVENASYGATMCAERSAIFNMVSSGARRIKCVCVYSPGASLAMPCGMCRQVIAEFCHDAAVLVAGPGGVLRRSFAELLPEAFRLEAEAEP